MLARLAIRALRDDIVLTPGNNIGYHGPYTELLVSAGASCAIGEGCLAGVTVLGIEADGTVKGCPSLPAERYAGGNIRTQRLSEMLARSDELAINLRARGRSGPGRIPRRHRSVLAAADFFLVEVWTAVG
jgi:MoaA/NifB/PqqE/SkfB family radical SAM enzyme